MDRKKDITDSVYKVIVIGDPSVGKGELLAKFAPKQFDEKYLPTVDFSNLKESIKLKEYEVTINLMFWDIARHPLHRPYFSGADGMLLVFDITRMSTFSNINNWYSSAVEYGLSEIPKILIGNKAHLKGQRKITLPMAEHLCEKLNAHYYETSSLTGHNVKEVFEKIAELIYRLKNLDEPEKNEKLIMKPYQGEVIETHESVKKFKRASIDSLIDPMWLWQLDHLPKDGPRFYLCCPMCRAFGKENFEIVEDESKILSYVSGVPMYAKKHICKRCGYEF